MSVLLSRVSTVQNDVPTFEDTAECFSPPMGTNDHAELQAWHDERAQITEAELDRMYEDSMIRRDQEAADAAASDEQLRLQVNAIDAKMAELDRVRDCLTAEISRRTAEKILDRAARRAMVICPRGTERVRLVE